MTTTDYSNLISHRGIRFEIEKADPQEKPPGALAGLDFYKVSLVFPKAPIGLFLIDKTYEDPIAKAKRTIDISGLFESYEDVQSLPEPKRSKRELPTTPGTVVRVGDRVCVRDGENWSATSGALTFGDDFVASQDWQLLVPAPDEPQEPQIVVDAEGADWIRRSDGTYREACAIWCVGDNPTLDELRKDSGPLALPDGSPA